MMKLSLTFTICFFLMSFIGGFGAAMPASALRMKILQSTPATTTSLRLASSPVGRSYGGLFYIQIPLGTPPTVLSLAIDTGSSPTWVQAADCQECFSLSTPSFNASLSSTFRRMLSDDNLCIPAFLYGNGSSCLYEVDYAVNQISKGDFGYDSFLIGPNTTQLAFGRGFYNRMVDFKGERGHQNEIAGILGLGRDHPTSVVHQLASINGTKPQFGYLLPVQNEEGFLVFGEEAVLKGPGVKSTPILGSPDEYYYLNMTGMSVNGAVLPINPELFISGGGVVIDSGTQYSSFVPQVYQALQDAVVDFFYPFAPLPLSKSGFHLCYDLDQVLPQAANRSSSSSVPEQVPTITFHFQGADLPLQPDTGFKVFEETNELCLMMLPIKEPDLPNIIGGFQQLHYWFQFNLAASSLSFVPAAY